MEKLRAQYSLVRAISCSIPRRRSNAKGLKLLTKEDEFSEKFEHLVLRFTDSTYDEIKQGGRPATDGCDAGLLKDSQNTTRHKLKHNLEARLLEEVLSPGTTGPIHRFHPRQAPQRQRAL
jgi:hypothetical protein